MVLKGMRQEVWSLIQTQGGGAGRRWFLAAGGSGVQERRGCSQSAGRAGGNEQREEGHWGLNLSVVSGEHPPVVSLSFSRRRQDKKFGRPVLCGQWGTTEGS